MDVNVVDRLLGSFFTELFANLNCIDFRFSSILSYAKNGAVLSVLSH